MVGFPTPPPLKQKPTLSVIPESVRKKIEHPERVTKLVIAFGVVGLLLFLIPSLLFLGILWLLFHVTAIPAVLIILLLTMISWYGFSFGMMYGRRRVIEALRDEDDIV
jgi:H+/Cl- antiporter ClcA